MKITQAQLNQLIQEELQQVLAEEEQLAEVLGFLPKVYKAVKALAPKAKALVPKAKALVPKAKALAPKAIDASTIHGGAQQVAKGKTDQERGLGVADIVTGAVGLVNPAAGAALTGLNLAAKGALGLKGAADKRETELLRKPRNTRDVQAQSVQRRDSVSTNPAFNQPATPINKNTVKSTPVTSGEMKNIMGNLGLEENASQMHITRKRLSEIIREELATSQAMADAKTGVEAPEEAAQLRAPRTNVPKDQDETVVENRFSNLLNLFTGTKGAHDLSQAKDKKSAAQAVVNTVEHPAATVASAVINRGRRQGKQFANTLNQHRTQKINNQISGGSFTNVRGGGSGKKYTIPGMTAEKAAAIKAANEKAWQNQQSGGKASTAPPKRRVLNSPPTNVASQNKSNVASQNKSRVTSQNKKSGGGGNLLFKSQKPVCSPTDKHIGACESQQLDADGLELLNMIREELADALSK